MLSVVIPWRAQESRLPALEAVIAWYDAQFAAADIHLVDSDDDLFNLARARNLGVARLDPESVVVINDADTIPQVEPLLAAIAAAATSDLVHLPYSEYHWLGPGGTAQFAAGAPLDACESELVRGACSGVYVTTPRAWALHGGQDERFRGWGFEDAAWYLAHGTLLGQPPQRHTGRVFALHHLPQARAGAQYDANAALMERYRCAADDPFAMRMLVAESASNARLLPGV